MYVKSWDMDHKRVFGITQEYFEDYIGNQKHYEGSLDLRGNGVKSLGMLERINGYLEMGTRVVSLGDLVYIGGHLNLEGSGMTSLGNLEYVGGTIYSSTNSIIYGVLMNSKFKDQVIPV